MRTQLMRKRRKSPYKAAIGSCLIVALSIPLLGSKSPTTLEKIQAQGVLKIISRNGPTTYYEGPEGLTGFEYSLAKAFADQIGVELDIQSEDNLAVLIDSVGTSAGDIGAAGLTITPKRLAKVRFSEPYLDVTQQIIFRRGNQRPESVEDLIGKDILVIANSAHAERLRELREDYPELRWRERTDLEMLDLLEMVHSGSLEYAIVDSNAYSLNRSVYPNAAVAFDISEPQQLAWAFPKQSDSTLFDAAQEFFINIQDDGRLAQLTEKYYGHAEQVSPGGALVFARRIESRLPNWEGLLKKAGEDNSIDWRLLAAMSYQESHWNSRARSHTGVRGLMMLTQATAKDMGVDNRIDPAQSIEGGAKYFRSILDRIPQQIQGADRTWMALAAYNVGMGHLEDARVLTERHGDDPNKWTDVEKYLPLLAKRKYYQTTKHGYARGWEPVAYVQNIRQFYNILSWHDHINQRRLNVADAETPKPELPSPDFKEVSAAGAAPSKVSLSL